MKPSANSQSNASACYSAKSAQAAVSLFRRKANGFYDVAFAAEDIRQEAAIAYWLAKQKSTKIIYRRLIEAYRRVSVLPRVYNRKGGQLPVMEELSAEMPEFSVQDEASKPLHDFVRRVRKTESHPKLEAFIHAFYVEDLTRAQVKQKLGITERAVQQHIKITKSLATDCF